MGIETQIINGTVHQTINFDEPSATSIIGVGIAIITAFFLWYQIHKQTKVDSARFSMDFLARTGRNYQGLLKEVKEKEEGKNTALYDPARIRLMLNHFEYIATFEDDGIINIRHIDEIFGQALLRIEKDVEIQKIISDTRKNDMTVYSNLVSLLEKIKKRH